MTDQIKSNAHLAKEIIEEYIDLDLIEDRMEYSIEDFMLSEMISIELATLIQELIHADQPSYTSF